MQLSLLEICVLIHYHFAPYAYRDIGNQDSVSTAESALLKKELLQYKDVNSEVFTTTERGAVYVEAIRNLPLPVQRWVMPSELMVDLSVIR